MKLRVFLIILGLCLLGSFIVLQSYINNTGYSAFDLPEVNNHYKSIIKELETASISEVEKKYSCNIILLEDRDYSNELYHAMNKSDVIFDYLKEGRLIGKIIFPANSGSFLKMKQKLSMTLWGIFAITMGALCAAVLFIYYRILLPFRKLKHFAHNISVGNLDIPLTMDRENYFGAFTESFDLMREELKRARQGEYKANISKKELVAELSHDIKTPVSTIKAVCELLEVKLKDEEALAKIKTINQKADIIDKLISNLFHATLEELEVLKIEPREELSTIILPMLKDLNHYERLHFLNELPECLIYCDRLRLNQVFDNIINNSYKYAGTDIDISFQEKEQAIGF